MGEMTVGRLSANLEKAPSCALASATILAAYMRATAVRAAFSVTLGVFFLPVVLLFVSQAIVRLEFKRA